MLPLLAQHGIRWIATDEEILSASTQGFISRDARGHVRNPDRMYRPYKVAEAGHELSIVFRDHALSDMIGFHYQRSEPAAAADDFVSRLRGIGQAVDGAGPALVSVILDGENCWEHYPDGGVAFLRALYQRCAAGQGHPPVRSAHYLEEHPPRDTLAASVRRQLDQPQLRHLDRPRGGQHRLGCPAPDARASREADCGCRTADCGQRGHSPQSAIRNPRSQAWEEIYIAEGSDWFWWYRRRPFERQDALFDYLFRKHLQNVYLLLGDTPPPDLARPISRRVQRAMLHAAAGFPGCQDRWPADVLRVDQRRPLYLPERTRYDGHGHTRAARRTSTSASTYGLLLVRIDFEARPEAPGRLRRFALEFASPADESAAGEPTGGAGHGADRRPGRTGHNGTVATRQHQASRQRHSRSASTRLRSWRCRSSAWT